MDYDTLLLEIESLTSSVPHFIANLANISAAIYNTLDNVNWVGFYLMQDGKLVLGPFQGKPACIEIPMGKGVCGTAASEDKSQLVKDVHAFPGHIACDSASNSEIVIPIHANGEVVGVLDIDSPLPARFGEHDLQGLEGIVKVLEKTVFSYFDAVYI